MENNSEVIIDTEEYMDVCVGVCKWTDKNGVPIQEWRIVIDRGDGLDTVITETSDMDKVYLRIGQMALSYGIEQIVVYRDGEEYRRYVLKREVETNDETH